MLICDDCKRVFERPNGVREKVGEYWGQPAYQTVDVCPFCHSDSISEAVKCEICGEYYTRDEMDGDVCDGCLYTYRFDLDTCEKFCESDNCSSSVKISDLVVSLLSEAEINEILITHLKEADKISRVDCKSFIDEDKEWFGEKVKEL